MIRRLIARILALVLAVGIMPCIDAARAAEPPGFVAGGTLTVCTNPTLPPMTFVDGTDTSALGGYDIDLARALAAAWHAKPEILTMDFEGMFPSLAASRCAMVISGVLRQAGREHNYDAVPYLDSAAVVIARSGTAPIHALDELSGRSVAVESGTSYAAMIERENRHLREAGRQAIALQLYPTEDQVIQQVLLGRVDALISQDVEVFYRQRQLGGKVSIILPIENPDYRAFAIYIRKNPADRARLTDAVAQLRQDGTLDALARKWNISSQQAQIFTQGGAASVPDRPIFDLHVFLSALVSAAFLRGAALTLAIAVLSHLTAIVISIPIALRLNAPGRSPLTMALTAYVAIFRGAPTLLQLLFIWNALPQFLPIFRESWFSPFLAAWISLSLNESAYQVEINRAALRAIDPGQKLAAEALGMNRRLVFRRVIFPQALRIALPPTINDFITLLKTTSLASVISLQELLAVTQIQVARSFQFTEYYAAALVYYLVMVFAFLALQHRVERRFAWADRDKATAHAG